MLVGLIAPPWVAVPPPEYGGTEEVIDLLARGLAKAGYGVVLFTTGDSTCAVPRRWVLPAALGTTAPAMAEIRHVTHAYEELAAYVDVIHDHTMFGPLYAERVPEIPVVATNHGLFDNHAIELYSRAAARVAVVAISHSQRASAPAVPIARVIHHGVDVDALRPQPEGGRGGYLAFLGRMSPDKGPHRAIAVARRAGLPLLIAAKMWEPDERRYFERWVEPHLGCAVRYVGQIKPAQKRAFLGNAVALLNPIQWDEPFGLVMAEALACGTPVIAHPMGAAPEIIDDGVTGFLCADEDDMVDRVRSVGGLDRLECRNMAVARFSAERMVADHVSLYETLMAGSPVPLHRDRRVYDRCARRQTPRSIRPGTHGSMIL